jgi:hypothetical protein
MELMQAGQKATDWYFRVGSEFTKALVNHLLTASDKNCILDRERRSIACFRGTGAGVRFAKPILHFAMPGEIQMISFDLEVVYEPNDDDRNEGRDSDHNIERAERIHYPADLELDFSKPKFDLWIHETRKKLRDERARPEHRFLEKLVKKYPDKAMELITKQRQKGS